jgi:hypothetical protein
MERRKKYSLCFLIFHFAQGVMSLNATAAHYTVQEIAKKIIPALSHMTIDPDSRVREEAFKAIKHFVSALEEQYRSLSDDAFVKEATRDTTERTVLDWASGLVNKATSHVTAVAANKVLGVPMPKEAPPPPKYSEDHVRAMSEQVRADSTAKPTPVVTATPSRVSGSSQASDWGEAFESVKKPTTTTTTSTSTSTSGLKLSHPTASANTVAATPPVIGDGWGDEDNWSDEGDDGGWSTVYTNNNSSSSSNNNVKNTNTTTKPTTTTANNTNINVKPATATATKPVVVTPTPPTVAPTAKPVVAPLTTPATTNIAPAKAVVNKPIVIPAPTVTLGEMMKSNTATTNPQFSTTTTTTPKPAIALSTPIVAQPTIHPTPAAATSGTTEGWGSFSFVSSSGAFDGWGTSTTNTSTNTAAGDGWGDLSFLEGKGTSNAYTTTTTAAAAPSKSSSKSSKKTKKSTK